MADLIGQSLGRYHILEQLGEGGMATVYRAFDTRLESEVAVKVIRTENLAPSILEHAMQRFKREAKALARLTHANIVKVLDYGEYDGRPYLVMPYLPGGTLKERLQGKPLPYREAARLLIPIARAVDFAHQEGVVHRDIKPSNILITRSGDPMLTDFGIAKIIDEEATLDLTGTTAMIGTPQYMAPEQFQGRVGPQTDIYSLGVVLYEMVTGRRPYEADTPAAIIVKQATDPLPRPKQFAPNLPDQVEQVLAKALSKNPENRYKTMGELAIALERLAGGIQEPPGEHQPIPGPRRNIPWMVWAGVSVVGIAVIAAGLLLWKGTASGKIIPTEPVPAVATPTENALPAALSVPANTPQQPVNPDGLLAKILERGYIMVATDPNYEPQSFLNTEGTRPADTKCPANVLTAAEMQGFDVDMAVYIGQALGVETCFATPGWDAITAGGWDDKWDVSVGSMTITTDRQKVLDFSQPYYYMAAFVAVRDDSGISRFEELSGNAALCAGAGTTYAVWLMDDVSSLGLPESSIYARVPSGISVLTRDTEAECVVDIAAGNAVGMVSSEGVIEADINAGYPLIKLDAPVFSQDLAAAFDKASSLSTESLNLEVSRIITSMHADGTLSDFSQHWFGMDLTKDPMP